MREILILSGALLLAASPVGATQLNAIEVAQPISTDNGTVLTHVTFLAFPEALPAGFEIGFICKPYEVPVEGGPAMNRNPASKLGIDARMVRSLDGRTDNLFGDSLRVVMDLTAVEEPGAWTLSTLDEIVAVVRQCVVEMAEESAARWPYPRFLDLRIEGSSRFQGLEAVIPLSSN